MILNTLLSTRLTSETSFWHVLTAVLQFPSTVTRPKRLLTSFVRVYCLFIFCFSFLWIYRFQPCPSTSHSNMAEACWKLRFISRVDSWGSWPRTERTWPWTAGRGCRFRWWHDWLWLPRPRWPPWKFQDALGIWWCEHSSGLGHWQMSRRAAFVHRLAKQAKLWAFLGPWRWIQSFGIFQPHRLPLL